MIHSLVHPGSGLGNQLFRVVAGKVLALDMSDEYSAIGRENFKGASFMNIDLGEPNDVKYHIEQPADKIIIDDSTSFIDGEFQKESDFIHRINEIREWLKVEPLELPDDLCIIGFRGGEYKHVPDLYLPRSYWTEAMMKMGQLHPNIKFHVVTDDIKEAQLMFMGLELTISHEIGMDWRSVRYAKHLIIANSSFYILPALLGDAQEVIAPEFWSGYNTGIWPKEGNQYKKFTYI